ncbi:hypothetical protein F5X99DRAFT_421235 [Biscogniauxia marginata]|nr:hypothetical protein F5X99DRAFT_421235 [Biscogniauxia marginata]
MASEQLGRPILGYPTQLPPSRQPETGVGIKKSPTTAARESPLEFRGFDFFAKGDLNQFKTASKTYFAPTTSAKRFSFNPSSWLGDATPPGSPVPSTEGSFAAAGRFPIPPDGKTPRPEKKILGLRRPWFWTLLTSVLVLVIVAIGVGVGVGASNRSHEGSREAASSSSPTSAGSDASVTTSDSITATVTETSTATSTPAAGAKIDCPAANGTTYQVPGSDKQFLRICGIDYSGDEATDIRQVPTEDMLDCMKNCAGTANSSVKLDEYLGTSGTVVVVGFKVGDVPPTERASFICNMSSAAQIETLREHVTRAIVDQLSLTEIDWSAIERLTNPVLCIETKFQDRSAPNPHQSTPGLAVSQIVDLVGLVKLKSGTPCDPPEHKAVNDRQQADLSSGTILPSTSDNRGPESWEPPISMLKPTKKDNIRPNSEERSDGEDQSSKSRKAISGLRPSRGGISVIEDNTKRQMQIASGSFPKRRKAEPSGYALKPSTLDKLIDGIWEQIHGGMTINPQDVINQFLTAPLLHGTISTSRDVPGLSLAPSTDSNGFQAGRPFHRANVFTRGVTQASRTCRSVEVIVQARWVEHFDAYVEHLRAVDPSTSDTKHRKTALVEACTDFAWPEKELRNKMAIWRGYKEIKDAGGWAALVFAGMGIYRFCKYRIGFDRESMQRLSNLRPALEVAADTMHPNWRQLLSIVGEPPQRIYHGHPHDWVIFLDGSRPTPLRTTYLQWDPYFSFRHIEECLVDERTWGCDDPRWTPPTDAVARASSLCETCEKNQSDDPKLNCCFCFPSLFGCARTNPSPVQVFRTPNGRSNGLLALCAFERGAAVGEFVGVITKGLEDVDVMESTTGTTNYQIWQGKQGNFTRFVNHSCNANAQYQRFTWLDTQRIILVSKGIEAGTEITVDYSDKYWKGLDKKCLCGEKSCRYRRDR